MAATLCIAIAFTTLMTSTLADLTLQCGSQSIYTDDGSTALIYTPSPGQSSSCEADIVIAAPQGYHVYCEPQNSCFDSFAVPSTVYLFDGNVQDSNYPMDIGRLASCTSTRQWSIVRARSSLSIRTNIDPARNTDASRPILVCSIEPDGPSNCGSDLLVSALHQDHPTIVTSPGWPYSYPNGANCQWNILLDYGTQAAVSCDHFVTEINYDYLSLSTSADGQIANCAGGSTADFLGNTAWSTTDWFTSPGTLTFTTDGSVVYPGFRCTILTATSSSMNEAWSKFWRAQVAAGAVKEESYYSEKPMAVHVVNATGVRPLGDVLAKAAKMAKLPVGTNDKNAKAANKPAAEEKH